MNSAVVAANGNGTPGRDFILVETSYTVAGDPANITGNDAVQVRACAGAMITVDDGQPLLDTNRVLFDVSGDGNVFDSLSIANVDDGYVMFALSGDANIVRNSTITSYERTGVLITGADNTVLNNVIGGGTAAVTSANAAAIMVNGNTADRNRIISNVLVQTAHDGIRVFDADDLLIDHNTIAHNAGDAISFVPGQAATRRRRQPVRPQQPPGEQPGRRPPVASADRDDVQHRLRAVPRGGLYGNDQVGNGEVCAGTACVWLRVPDAGPGRRSGELLRVRRAARVHEHELRRRGLLLRRGADADRHADVVDGDLVAVGSQPHDLNGREPGDFVSTAPDIGGRENGAEGCY